MNAGLDLGTIDRQPALAGIMMCPCPLCCRTIQRWGYRRGCCRRAGRVLLMFCCAVRALRRDILIDMRWRDPAKLAAVRAEAATRP
jgi:hypothetical protein